jgi:hypothetical protein
METLFPYRFVRAVQTTLERAAERPFVLSRAQDPEDWFHLEWFQDFLKTVDHRELPLRWEEEPALSPLDTLQVATELPGREITRAHRTGSITIRREALVSSVAALRSDGLTKILMVLGECVTGALERLRSEYDLYARRRSREWPHLYVVGGDPLPRPTGLDWDDLIVAPSLGSDLRRQVETFFTSRDAFVRLRVPHRRGILLTGPPGNGKTTAIRIVASRRPEPFYLFSLTEESERFQLDEAFDQAAYDAPSILCFEDVDSLFEKPGTLSHFLNRMDGLHPLDGVLVLATTNHPEKLDAAILERPSRFDRVYLLGNPGPDERRRYLRRAWGAGYDEAVIAWTEGFSLAQLKEVIVSASLEAVDQGLHGVTGPSVRRAAERLRGQKEAAKGEWDHPRVIGFQLDRPNAPRNLTS